MSNIKTLPFGDKSAIARTLTTKGAELKASIVESAILPIVSNALAGHSTFKPLISGKSFNKACPLQAALWGLLHTKTGKASTTATARAINEAFKLAAPVAAQSAHDEAISDAIIMIAEALTPAPREATAKTDYKGQAESLAAQLEASQIDLSEARAQLTEARAQLAEARAQLEAVQARPVDLADIVPLADTMPA